MFGTSSDILNISLSAAVVIVAIFLCFALYYIIANLRRLNKISGQIEKGIDKAEGFMELIQEKIKQSQSYFFLFGKLAERAIDYIISKKGGKEDEEDEEEKMEKEERNERREKKREEKKTAKKNNKKK